MANRLLLFVLTFFSFVICDAQLQSVSSTRMDELKIKMPLDSVNRLLQNKIRLKELKDNYTTDTIWVNYKGDSVMLTFARFLNEKNAVETYLQSMYSTGKNLKTRSGIRPGDSKFDVIKKLDGSNLRIGPDWHYENAPDKKLYSTVVLYDYTNDTILIFYFYNNVLYGFECASSEADC